MWEVLVRCESGHAQTVIDPLKDVDGNYVVKAPDSCKYCPTQVTKERELTRREKRAMARAIKKLERM